MFVLNNGNLIVTPEQVGTFDYVLEWKVEGGLLIQTQQFQLIVQEAPVVPVSSLPYWVIAPSPFYVATMNIPQTIVISASSLDQTEFTLTISDIPFAQTYINKGIAEIYLDPVTPGIYEYTANITQSGKLILSNTFSIKIESNVTTTTKNETVNATTKYIPSVKTTNSTNATNQTQWRQPNSTIPVAMKISEITPNALVTVKINQQLLISSLDQMIVQYNKSNSNDNKVELLNHYFLKNDTNVTEFQLQLNFSSKLSVSQGKKRDVVIIVVPFMQAGSVKQYYLQSYLPKLVASEEELKQLQSTADNLKSMTTNLFYIYLACSLFFSFALGMLWGTFQTLQVIIAMPLLQVLVPANVTLIFQGFNDIVNLQIVDPSLVKQWTLSTISNARNYTDEIFSLQNSTKNATRLLQDDNDVTSNFILIGLGLAILIVLVLLTVICYSFCLPKIPCLRNILLKIKHKLMWSAPLRYITTSYLKQAIIVSAAISQFADRDRKDQAFAVIEFVYLILTPVLIYLLLRKQKDKLGQQQTKDSIGTLYLNYETDKSSALHFTSVFLARRLFFAFTISFCSVTVFQVWLSIHFSLLLLIYVLYWQPMDQPTYDFLAIFNEAVLLVSCYLMFLYTDYVPDAELRYQFGDMFLYLLYVNFGLNIFLMFVEIGKIICKHCKRWNLHRKMRLKAKVKNTDQKLQDSTAKVDNSRTRIVDEVQLSVIVEEVEVSDQSCRDAKDLQLLQQQLDEISSYKSVGHSARQMPHRATHEEIWPDIVISEREPAEQQMPVVRFEELWPDIVMSEREPGDEPRSEITVSSLSSFR